MIRISYFASEKEQVPQSIQVEWEQLATQLSEPRYTVCTPADCVGAKCPHKLGEAWSPAVYAPHVSRSKKGVAAVSLLVLDIDHVASDDTLIAIDQLLAPYRRLMHVSHSDRPGDRCVRFVLALSAPVPGFEWDRFRRQALTELGVAAYVDRQTSDASRIFFLPSRPTGADFLSDATDGAPVDVGAILAKAPPADAPPDRMANPTAAPASSEVVQAAALQLAAAWPATGRHHAFLALAGALATHGWAENQITELTTLVARMMPGCDEKAIRDRPTQARDSIAKVQRGEVVSGWGSLAQVLTRPDVVKGVREGLGMRDVADLVFDGILKKPALETTTRLDGYPSLEALNLPRSMLGAAPVVTAEPGTYLAALQQARSDVTKQLGTEVATAEDLPLFQPARDLFGKVFEPTKWLIEGLIVEGGVAAIVAEPKSAKSWLALELAASVSSGLRAIDGRFGVPRARTTAYFFAEDMAQSVRNRLRAFAAGRGITGEALANNLHVQPRGRHLDVTRDEDLARIVASCRMIGAVEFLVLDPLRDIQSGEENSSDDMSKVFARIRALEAILGCTVLIVHHARKPDKKSGADDRIGNVIRGSSAIYGSLDALISLRDLHTDNGETRTVFTNTVEAEVKGAKSAGKFPLTLTVEDGPDMSAIRAVWSTGPSAPTTPGEQGEQDQLMTACLEYMMLVEVQATLPPRTTFHIREKLKKNQLLVAAALHQAEQDGYVAKHLVKSRQKGWVLTDAGRSFVRDDA